MQRLVIRLLGEPAVKFEDRPRKWTALPRCLPILAVLAGKSDVPLTRASLAASVWPDELDNEARANLRRHLHSLQRALPEIDGVEWIVSDDRTIAWNDAAPAWIDVRAFEEAAADPSRAEEALEAYRGDLLEGFYDDCVMAERERLRDIYLKLLARLITDARDARDFPSAIRYAEKLLAADEWREDAVRAWIACTCEAGDRSGALAAYERFARRLREEFSAEPMAETTALRDAIRAGVALPQGPHAPFLSERSESATRAWRLPFVGRAEAFEKLRAAWSRAARRTGSVAFVSGEAGIGKSRLVSEIAALVTEQGGHVLVGHTSNPETEPYQAFVTALRPLLPSVAHADRIEVPLLAALTQVFPEVLDLAPEARAYQALPDDRARERLYEAFVRLVEQASKIRPLCLVLEDLHWAGAAALDLLGVLARRVGTLALTIVATYRSEESPAGHPLRALRAALVGERRALTLALERLAPDDIAAMIAGVAGDAPKALGEAVNRLSEGNPLFVAQLLEAFHESGDVPDASAMTNIGDAIVARARRFDPAVRAVAEVAATLGDAFRADFVADLGGWNENAVLDGIGVLADRGLVREAGGGTLEYVFTHALVAASFYAASPLDARAARHRRAAQLLERSRGTERSTLTSIARHWKLAGDVDRASEAYARASRDAFGVYAHDEGIRYGRDALALCADPRRRFGVLQSIVRAESGGDALEQWERDLAELEALAPQLDDAARYAALGARGRFLSRSGDREAQSRAIDEMAALAEQNASPEWKAEVAEMRGALLLSAGRFQEAAERFRGALSISRTLGNRDLTSWHRRRLAQTLIRCGDLDAASVMLEEARLECARDATIEERLNLAAIESTFGQITENPDLIERSAEVMRTLGDLAGDQLEGVHARMLFAFASGLRRDIGGVRRHYGEAAARLEGLRQRSMLAIVHTNMGLCEAEAGFVERAVEHWKRSAELAEQIESRDMLAGAFSNLAEGALALGDVEGAYRHAVRARDIALPTGEHRLIASTLGTLGKALGARGNPKDGIALVREAIDSWRMVDATQSLIEELCTLVGLLILAKDRAAVQTAAGELCALYERDPERVRNPRRTLVAIANARRFLGDEPGALRFLELGRKALASALATVGSDEDRRAFLALPENRELTAR